MIMTGESESQNTVWGEGITSVFYVANDDIKMSKEVMTAVRGAQ
jgi:hypothetical protein